MTPAHIFELAKRNEILPDKFGKEVSKMLTGLRREAASCDAGVRIYRAQKMTLLPTDVKRMSYPPLEKTKLGRANLAGQQIFYASARLNTTFNETKPKVGDCLHIGEWESTKKMILQPVGLRLDENSIEQFMHEVFTNPGDEMYQYTAWVSSLLLSGDCIDGLLYPSIVSHNQSHNFALKKKFVDESLRLISVKTFLINGISQNFQYQVEQINFATPLENGQLEWKNRRHQWKITENYGWLSLEWNGWDFEAKNQYGQLVDPV